MKIGSRPGVLVLAAVLGPALLASRPCADVPAGSVLHETDYSYGDDYDWYGFAVASLPDFDGDGIPDMAVGCHLDDEVTANSGAVYVMQLRADGLPSTRRKIANKENNFPHVLMPGDWFGYSVTPVGDFDGNGIMDIAVGAPGDDGNGVNRGAVWIVYLNALGQSTGAMPVRIADGTGGFSGVLDDHDLFGSALTGLGDLDGDGVPDLAVGAVDDDDGGADQGALWILFLNPDATVKAHAKISGTSGGFGGPLDDGDLFGTAVSVVGDLDGNGTVDLAVGARGDDDGGPDRGAVWILFLAADGTVVAEQKVSDTAGAFTGGLGNGDRFGTAVARLGDLDGDGVTELAITAPGDDGNGPNAGTAWVAFLTDGYVLAKATFRNDYYATNTAGYFALRPVLGRMWTATVDNAPGGNTIAGVVAFLDATELHVPGIDDYLLVDPLSPGGELLRLPPQAGSAVVAFTVYVPDDVNLCGLSVSTQGFGVGGAPTTLHNAYDLYLGTY